MPPKKPGRKPTQISTFDIKDVERDFDKVIEKYRHKGYPRNVVSTAPLDKIASKGFHVVIMLRDEDRLTTKSFGRDMPADVVADGLASAISELLEALNRESKIGIA